MADHRQEEELGQEEASDQEEQDHLHQEEQGKEAAAQHQGAPHHSRQEEQVIQAVLHPHLQVYRLQIHGVHSIDPESLFQS